ncbi:MAG: response regulator [Chitinophagaceae bacterium]|nr:response regulator [Chitinophagaceae bacterium]
MIKVLVIDDDEDLLEMVILMLQKYGIEAESTTGGDQLFKMMDRQHPDVVLMDIYLGREDGRDLCKHIKTTGKYAGTAVVLYSAGYITPASIVDSGADAFLQKPFDMKQLLSYVKAFSGAYS